ncbi:MAG: polysaccharide deacetylase [Pseudomonadota bacterium]
MARHLVCMTFDFDAMSGFVARGLTSPTPISRGEFGAIGAQRLVALLAKYDVPATWFIPGVVIGTYPDVCQAIVEGGHEVGHHGWTHTPPAMLTREEEEAQLVRGNEAIRSLTGRAALGYRSPSWDLSEHTVELLLKHQFVYESSMMGHDHHPYYARQGDVIPDDAPMRFGQSTSLVEMPISWSLDDFPHFEFMVSKRMSLPGLAPASGVLENWLADFQYMQATEIWGVLTYTCHPYVIGRGHRLLMLERLITELRDAGAVFVTLAEAVAEYRGRGDN